MTPNNNMTVDFLKGKSSLVYCEENIPTPRVGEFVVFPRTAQKFEVTQVEHDYKTRKVSVWVKP